MNWKCFFLGLGVGIIGATIISEVSSNKLISSNHAVKLVKEALSQNGKITGSWIHVNPETYTNSNITYTVYKGGISCKINDELHQYEFIVDAKTGTILKVA